MKSIFAASALVGSLFTQEANGDARASFADNGIVGYVDVMDGSLMIMLNISDLMAWNYTGVPDGAACFTGGLKYHIHEKWTYGDNGDRLEGDCGGDYTGGHWDPWLGCGSATGNEYCSSQDGCVEGSSALSGSTGYDCSTDTFDENAYACEVGDWNGKYGLAMVDDMGIISISGSSPFEVSGDDIADVMSVVFHCNGGDRAFCAPFETTADSGDARPTQEDDGAEAYFAPFVNEDGNITGGVRMYPNGTVQGVWSTDGMSCTDDEYSLRIYNDWDMEMYGYSAWGSDNCNMAVGSFYDPTVSCAYDSDSEYCTGDDMSVCGSNSTYWCDWDENRFGCAPGDLSGKYSYLCIDGNCLSEAQDPLMIDLELLEGKSVVVQCADDYTIQVCGGFFTMEDITGADDDDDADDDDADDDDDDDDDDDSANRLFTVGAGIIALISLALN